MIPILSPEQLRIADEATIRIQGITPAELMERAASAFVQEFRNILPEAKRVAVVCGTGNNGGDGLAVARLWSVQGLIASVFIVGNQESGSPDFRLNLNRVSQAVAVKNISGVADLELNEVDVVIDALFGFGLNRPVEGIHRAVIEYLNGFGKKIVAVDVPSGMMAGGGMYGPVVQAALTITFQLPKLAFLLPETGPCTGEWRMVDIGLDHTTIKAAGSREGLVQPVDIRSLYRPRPKFSHKGLFGHVLIAGGSRGMTGAPVLSAMAALRTGAGLVTAHIPRCGEAAFSIAPEVMTDPDQELDLITVLPDPSRFRTAAIGPGMGTDKETAKALVKFLEQADYPVVLDADALNILSADSGLLNIIPRNSVLTPHPGEFKRLVGDCKNDPDRFERMRQLATRLHIHVLLKGAYSAIALPDGHVVFNNSGNPFMSTAGSGDVLTGMIAALIGQGYPPGDAALAGAFLHGKAGDLAAGGGHPVVATDLIRAIPGAWEAVFGRYSGLD